MKLKGYSLIALILGAFISVIGFLMPVIYWSSYTSQHGAIGIIGGADAPQYPFIVSSLFDGLPLVLAILGISLVVSSVFCLVFSKTVRKHCDKNTSALSVGLSGLFAFLCFSAVAFVEISKHPMESPVSIILSIVCLLAFIALIAVYFKQRRIHWSIKGFVIDVMTSILYLPTFFLLFSYLYEILR